MIMMMMMVIGMRINVLKIEYSEISPDIFRNCSGADVHFWFLQRRETRQNILPTNVCYHEVLKGDIEWDFCCNMLGQFKVYKYMLL